MIDLIRLFPIVYRDRAWEKLGGQVLINPDEIESIEDFYSPGAGGIERVVGCTIVMKTGTVHTVSGSAEGVVAVLHKLEETKRHGADDWTDWGKDSNG